MKLHITEIENRTNPRKKKKIELLDKKSKQLTKTKTNRKWTKLEKATSPDGGPVTCQVTLQIEGKQGRQYLAITNSDKYSEYYILKKKQVQPYLIPIGTPEEISSNSTAKI